MITMVVLFELLAAFVFMLLVIALEFKSEIEKMFPNLFKTKNDE